MEVQIDADDREALQESDTVPGREIVSKSWPDTDAETYKIAVTERSNESIYGFDLVD